MKRYFIHLNFKGTNYHGWQVQENALTVQGELQNAFSILLKEKIKIIGCGRTDTGVHARNFYAHFDTKKIDLSTRKDIIYKLNRLLPEDIAILGIYATNKNAHSRFDALSRIYKYYICTGKNVFKNDYLWQQSLNLDIEIMNKVAEQLKNYKDFTSFSKLHSNTKTNYCKIYKAYWQKNNEVIIFTIEADRFLRNMVRSIVGTLIDVGKGKIDYNDFCRIIEAKDRNKAGMSVPAKGLFLEDITYPYNIKG
jgi:tRNA pseudouridine38-40 synthase